MAEYRGTLGSDVLGADIPQCSGVPEYRLNNTLSPHTLGQGGNKYTVAHTCTLKLPSPTVGWLQPQSMTQNLHCVAQS